MADKTLLRILDQGVDAWNAWRLENPDEKVDLSGADLGPANLRGGTLLAAIVTGAVIKETLLGKANLHNLNLIEAKLSRADLTWTDLSGADLTRCDLSEAKLVGATLVKAKLSGANLSGADLFGANLSKADLKNTDLGNVNLIEADASGAKLLNADLRLAALVNTTLNGADLTGARIHGISAWNVNLKGAIQRDLIITRSDESSITVDNLEVAQFIYLLLTNEKIRDVIDTITSKVVLILGRFTKERKATLDTLRDRLRQLDLSPIMFDFPRPTDRHFTETVKILAQLARFVIVDFTAARSVQQELQATVPTLAIPFVPIIKKGRKPWSMARDFNLYHWVLPLHVYEKDADLLVALEHELIPAATHKREELRCLKK